MGFRHAVIFALATVVVLLSCDRKQQMPPRQVAPVSGSGPADVTTEKQTPENAVTDAVQPASRPADLSTLVVDQKEYWYGWYNPDGWAFEKTLPKSIFGGLFFVKIMPPDQPQGLEEYAAMLLEKPPYFTYNFITTKEEIPDGWIIKGDMEIAYDPEEMPWQGPGFVMMRRIGGTVILCLSERFDDKAAFDEAIDLCRSARFEP